MQDDLHGSALGVLLFNELILILGLVILLLGVVAEIDVDFALLVDHLQLLVLLLHPLLLPLAEDGVPHLLPLHLRQSLTAGNRLLRLFLIVGEALNDGAVLFGDGFGLGRSELGQF